MIGLRSGEQLKEIRSRLGITTRDVEDLSRKIAEAEGNEEFYISNAWLTQIENKQSVPSIYKLYSLSIIYRIRFGELLALFGVDLDKSTKFQLAAPLEKTHLVRLEVPDESRAITFPVRFDQGFSLQKTQLLSRMVEIWGEVPISLIQSLDIKHSQYGFIGLKDFTMYPLLRPGSFVQIDDTLNKVQSASWRTEYDRPIYFIELRDGYACSWCEQRGSQITLVPHPLSPSGIRQYFVPDEAEIVGQVTGVAMRIVNPPAAPEDEIPKLPKRS